MEKVLNNRQNRGITLIALVVTIVVLLILAGVSINMVLGQNGLIAKAKEAKTESAKATAKDVVSMLMSEWQIAQHTTNGDLAAFLNSKVPSIIDGVTENTDGTFDIEKDGYMFTVSSTGEILGTSKIGPKPQVSNIKVVANSNGTGENLPSK